MTEEKRKRGRPRKIKPNEYGVPENPPSKETGRTVTLETSTGKVTVIDPVSLDLREVDLNEIPGADKVKIKFVNPINGKFYDPFKNDRFKSKNNLK